MEVSDARSPTADAPLPPAAELVPESWPPADPVEPVRPRRIPWLLAPLAIPAVLLTPRRAGPHLIGSSWLAAYMAHAVSLVLFLGLFFSFSIERGNLGDFSLQGLTFAEVLRTPLAGFVLMLHTITSQPSAMLVSAIVVGAAHAAVWLGAVLLMPWCWSGETRRRLYLRSVKIVLWSAACLVVIPLSFSILPPVDRMRSELAVPAGFGLFFAWVIWWLTVMLRLGDRYTGPKDGRAWQPLDPRCEACGYSLILLPLTGRCPECGRPVCDSLPRRRRLPAFAAARGPIRKAAAYLPTLLSSDRLARDWRVRSGRRAARQFAMTSCLLAGMIVAAFSILDAYRLSLLLGDHRPLGFSDDAWLWFGSVGLETGLVVLFAAALTVLLLAGLLSVAGVALTLREPSRGIVLCYSAGWLILPALLAGLGCLVWSAARGSLDWFSVRLPVVGVRIGGDGIMIGLALLPAAAAVIWWAVRLAATLRATRFASA